MGANACPQTLCQEIEMALPPTGSTHQTRLGTFEWEGPHLKWCCDGSNLGDELDLMIDAYEVTERELRKIEKIYRRSSWYRRIALLRARKALKERSTKPSEMQFDGIGLSSLPYPNGFTLDFKYPESVWPDGELAVYFWSGFPISFEEGG